MRIRGMHLAFSKCWVGEAQREKCLLFVKEPVCLFRFVEMNG